MDQDTPAHAVLPLQAHKTERVAGVVARAVVRSGHMEACRRHSGTVPAARFRRSAAPRPIRGRGRILALTRLDVDQIHAAPAPAIIVDRHEAVGGANRPLSNAKSEKVLRLFNRFGDRPCVLAFARTIAVREADTSSPPAFPGRAFVGNGRSRRSSGADHGRDGVMNVIIVVIVVVGPVAIMIRRSIIVIRRAAGR